MPDPDDADAADPGWLLALETATGRGSVALVRGDTRLARELPESLATSESLLPAIDGLLAEAGCRVGDVERFAVSIGPGSFTGLRIGVATVKGLAFASDAPVAPVPTLAALALRADPGPGPVVAVLDARREEVYAAAYGDPELMRPDVLAEGLYAGADLARRLPPVCRLVGDAAALRCAPLRDALGPGVAVAARGEAAHASDVAWLGERLLAHGEACEAAVLVPRYVRRAQAEALRTGVATEQG